MKYDNYEQYQIYTQESIFSFLNTAIMSLSCIANLGSSPLLGSVRILHIDEKEEHLFRISKMLGAS